MQVTGKSAGDVLEAGRAPDRTERHDPRVAVSNPEQLNTERPKLVMDIVGPTRHMFRTEQLRTIIQQLRRETELGRCKESHRVMESPVLNRPVTEHALPHCESFLKLKEDPYDARSMTDNLPPDVVKCRIEIAEARTTYFKAGNL